MTAPIRDLVRVPGKLPRAVAGTGALHKEVLRRHLGLSRFVYSELLRRRDPKTGVVTVTARVLALVLPGASRGKRATVKAVKQHLQKLEALGLVKTLGRATNPNNGPKRRLYWRDATGTLRFKLVVDRMVYGAPGLGELHAVPRGVQLAIEKREALGDKGTQGGRRAGAGRPKGTKGSGGKRTGAGRPKGVKDGSGKARFKRHCGGVGMSRGKLISETERLWAGSVSGVKNQIQDSPFNQTYSPLYSPLLLSLLFPFRTKAIASSSKEEEGCAASGAQAVPLRGGDERDTHTPAPVSDSALASLREGMGPRLGIAIVSPYARGIPHPLIPSFVSLANTPDLCVQTPPRPRLDDRETPERHAYLLMRWYEGAVKAVFGKEPGTFKRYRRGPATSPHFALLVAAAKLFIAEDIAPAAWLEWSASVWQVAGHKGLPPLKYMFGAKRIEERVGWYRRESGSYSGHRTLYSPRAKDFLRRQTALRDAMSSVRTEEDLKAVVGRYFPGSSHAAALEELRAESASLREELERITSNGEWIWA